MAEMFAVDGMRSDFMAWGPFRTGRTADPGVLGGRGRNVGEYHSPQNGCQGAESCEYGSASQTPNQSCTELLGSMAVKMSLTAITLKTPVAELMSDMAI